jgi:membrane protein
MSLSIGTLSLWRTRRAIVRGIWDQIQADDCFDLAAQVSFYFILSLLPFFVVLAAVVGWLPSTTLWKSFVTWMVAYLPSESRRLVFTTIFSLSTGSKGFVSLGLLTTLWSASSGFVGLMESLSLAYGVRDSRSFWRKHAIAACLTVLAGIFMIACFGVMALGRLELEKIPALRTWNLPHAIWGIGSWMVTLVLACLAVDFLNFLLPDAKRRWRWLSPGTGLVILTLAISSLGLNLYVRHFSSFDKIYGTLGGLIVLMLWIYIASLVLLIGAETDHGIEKLTNGPETQKTSHKKVWQSA